MASGNSNVTITKDTGTIEAGAFSGLSNLATVTTGKITKVEDGAFSNCPCLREVKLERVEEVGQGLFNESVNLEKVTVKEDGPKIAYLIAKDLICNGPMQAIDIYMGESFYKTVSQRRPCITKKHAADFILLGFVDCEVTDRFSPDDETKINTIKKGAFEGIDKINEVDATKILYIEDEAFKGCENLKNISLGNIEKIGENVFSGCIGLKKVSVADEGQVELLGGKLKDCSLEQQIDIYVGDGLVYSVNKNCKLKNARTNTELTDVINEVQHLDDDDVEGMLVKLWDDVSEIPDGAFTDCPWLKEINLDSVKTIGKCAFQGCSGLTSINLSSVETIKENAFDGCTGLEKVEKLSENIREIGKEAFKSCPLLGSIELSKIQTVGDCAFSGCCSLEEINLSSIEAIGINAFRGCCNLKKIITSNEDKKRMIEDSTNVDALIIIE